MPFFTSRATKSRSPAQSNSSSATTTPTPAPTNIFTFQAAHLGSTKLSKDCARVSSAAQLEEERNLKLLLTPTHQRVETSSSTNNNNNSQDPPTLAPGKLKSPSSISHSRGPIQQYPVTTHNGLVPMQVELTASDLKWYLKSYLVCGYQYQAERDTAEHVDDYLQVHTSNTAKNKKNEKKTSSKIAAADNHDDHDDVDSSSSVAPQLFSLSTLLEDLDIMFLNHFWDTSVDPIVAAGSIFTNAKRQLNSLEMWWVDRS